MYTVRRNDTNNARGVRHPPYRGMGFKKPVFCRISRAFDENHLRVSGYFCRHKHAIFRWKGVRTRTATVLSDSLAKWVRDVRFTDIQAIPGVNLRRANEKVLDYTFHVQKYSLIILAIATNDVETLDKHEIVANLSTLVNTIKKMNPLAKIAYSAIISRPKDIPSQMEQLGELYRQKDNPFLVTVPTTVNSEPKSTSSTNDDYTPPKKLTTQQIYAAHPVMEKKRRQINKAIRRYCDMNGIFFLQSWKAMQLDDRSVNLDYFARDGLHLSEAGIDTLKCYLEGNVATLIDEHKLTRGLKGAKMTKNK